MKKISLITLLILGLQYSSFADHDISADVNFGSLIHFGGTITGVEWAEPHVLLKVVGNPHLINSPHWLVLLDSPENLKLKGYSIDSFEVLSRISIIGYHSKGIFRPGESLIYGLYHSLSPSNRVLLNDNLLAMVENASGLRAIPTDDGDVFRYDP